MSRSIPFLCFLSGFTFAQNERVVFDIDLSNGKAAPGIVSGGVWDGGWKCTGAKDERIVFDAGAPIANGYLEAKVTIDELPWKSQQGKINWIGLHEDRSLTQNGHSGDLFYARTGNPSYKFSNVKAAGRHFDRTEHEPRVGAVEDWVADGKTVHTIRLEWRDGVPIVSTPNGKRTIVPRDVIGGDTPIDRLRHVFLGSDQYTGLTVKGMRFLHVKLADLGPNADAPEAEPLSTAGRWFQDSHGNPVFLVADVARSLPKGSSEEIEKHLRQRRAQRFNAVAIESGTIEPAKRLGMYTMSLDGATASLDGKVIPVGSSRSEAYRNVFGGAPGYAYQGSEPQTMTHLAKLMNSISEGNLATRRADNSLLTGDGVGMRTENAKLALIYLASGKPVEVAMSKLAPGPMNVRWFNPRNGFWRAEDIEAVEHRIAEKGVPSGPGAPPRIFGLPGKPGSDNDWVLVLCACEGI